jgi:DNA-binding FadR family transcriptional regulator
MLRIFRGEFPPGTRLPPERRFAADLGVDRTSLRMAIKMLARMNLVVARHGSGVEVVDYRVHGGLDLIAAMFSLDELPLEGSLIVEALDFWLEMFCSMAAKAVVRMSLDEVRRTEQLLDRAVAAGDDVDEIVAAQMELSDMLAEVSGSTLFRMLNNSTRAIRARLMRLLPETSNVGAAMQDLRQLVRAAAVARPTEELARAGLLAMLRKLTANLRQKLLFGGLKEA